MANGINLDRPFLMRKAHDVNMKIFMYFDQPGVYLNVHGGTVPDTIAEKAGFDIKRYAKAKLKAERMAAFREQVEAELEDDTETESKVLYEQAGFKVIGLALGMANVLDPDGEKLNDKPISIEEAELLVKMMTEPQTKQKGKVKGAEDAHTAA